ncbi:hypothetical protein STEG23_033132, partial [Scotinomys teguina]
TASTLVCHDITFLGKQPRCPSTEEWIRKMWFIYTMEYYAAEKNNDFMKFAGKWMELENVILSENMEKELEILQLWKDRMATELDSVISFWTDYSHDQEFGGFSTCLTRDGRIYDEVKYLVPLAKQVWMYCHLYRTVERFRRDDLLDAAKSGGEFLIKFARVQPPSKKCAFAVSREGVPEKGQMSIITESYFALAMNELWRTTNEIRYQNEAVEMMDQIVYWLRVESSEFGKSSYIRYPDTEVLYVPTLMLRLVDQFQERDETMAKKYAELEYWSVQRILKHLQRDGQAVLEHISLEGKELPGAFGRELNPGQAIESGRYLLQYALRKGDTQLRDKVIDKFILMPFNYGWDKIFGGIYSYLDVDGWVSYKFHDPVYREVWIPGTRRKGATQLKEVFIKNMEKEREKLQFWKDRMAMELDSVISFWTDYSHDKEYGGFLTCLTRDGRIYDEVKYLVPLAKQVWMYCHLYRTVERFRRDDLLDAAKSGGEFLIRFARVDPPSKKCAFAVSREGVPEKVQMSVITESYFTLAMNELWRTTNEIQYQNEAVEMMDQIAYWLRVDSSEVGESSNIRYPDTEVLEVPTLMLRLVDEFQEGDEEMSKKYAEVEDWCVQRILMHLQRDGQAVLEHISPAGKELPGAFGRVLNPGQAIEAGRYLLQYALRKGDTQLRDKVIDKFILMPFNYGWDKLLGGIYSYLDVDGWVSDKYEWSLKLWWTHCEAMVAFLMAYTATGDPSLLEIFYQLTEYCFQNNMEKEREKLQFWKDRMAKELDSVISFWTDYSHDKEYGGFLTCLTRNGRIYDEVKYLVPLAKQVWMYCHLYRTVERFRRDDLLDAAKSGGEFLIKFARVQPPSKKCAFAVSREGVPEKGQMSVITETYFTLAMNELWRTTNEIRYQNEAVVMMDQIVYWLRVDSSEVGETLFIKYRKTEVLYMPTLLLRLVDQFQEGDEAMAKKYAEAEDWCVQRILMHLQRDGQAVLEHISPAGKELPGAYGRVLNPGQAIEAGRYLLQYALRKGDTQLRDKVIDKFILMPFNYGWDKYFGGIYSYQDADGWASYLHESSLKQWWTHCEAMVAFLMAYTATGDPALLTNFYQVADYSFQNNMEKEREKLQFWKDRMAKELDSVISFWTDFSHDKEYGGFLTCLTRNGRIYDEVKYLVPLAKQVWMYCHLYRTVERFRRDDLLDAAKSGGEFLIKFARVQPPSKKCAFAVSREGVPEKGQMSVITETYFALAMNELWRTTNEIRYQNEAVVMMDQIVYWLRVDSSEVGETLFIKYRKTEVLYMPTLLLRLVDQFQEGDEAMAKKYAEVEDWCVQRILMHLQRDGQAVLEHISPAGKELPGAYGRVLNPGQAIEAGRYLLQYALRKGDTQLRDKVIDKFILMPFNYGWDKYFGGIYSYQDADGWASYLHESSLKQWWTHCEAMVAFLMAYTATGDPALLTNFYQVADYSFQNNMEKEREKLQFWKDRMAKELDSVISFWTDFSHDKEYGGFLTCLTRNGRIYDEVKYLVPLAKQVWMYCHLYRTVERFRRDDLLDAAKSGGEFLIKFARVQPPSKKCAFAVSREGVPEKGQMSVITETYFALAMNELWRTTNEIRYQNEAVVMMDQIVYWLRVDSSEVGETLFIKYRKTEVLYMPTLLLRLVDQFQEGDEAMAKKYAEVEDWCVQRILMHLQRDGQAVLEHISPAGKELPGAYGRVLNPGQAIEAGRYLLQYALRKGDTQLRDKVIDKFILMPFNYGWDKYFGGIYSYQDADGWASYLHESSLKQWWTHCEAMVAFLMAYTATGDPALLTNFYQVADYSFQNNMEKEREKLQFWKDRMAKELDSVISFWTDFSHDKEYGGFLTCLTRDGRIYDEVKYLVPLAKQVWMYCHLYRTVERFRRDDLLDAAKSGGEFLIKFARVQPPSKKCAFAVSREGVPEKGQMSVITETYFALAMNELWRTTNEIRYQNEAVVMMDQIVYWLRVDSSEVGETLFIKYRKTEVLYMPTLLLRLVDQFQEGDEAMAKKYAEAEDWCVQRILMHLQRDGQAVLEHISPAGKELPGAYGRVLNPGQAIEAGRYLLQYALRKGDTQLRDKVIDKFILMPFNYGWDKYFGGIYSYQDADGWASYLHESSLKQWWTHCEAMVAFLMAYTATGDPALLTNFYQVADYSFQNFHDAIYREWYGYLVREGKVLLNTKGGLYK